MEIDAEQDKLIESTGFTTAGLITWLSKHYCVHI